MTLNIPKSVWKCSLSRWKKYVGFDSWNHQEVGTDFSYPGSIDNSDLFAGTTNIIEKAISHEKRSFEVLPWGGGGL